MARSLSRSSAPNDADAQQPRKRRRRLLQHLFLGVGCVLLIDALVGDKGLLAMLEARQRFRQLEQSLAAARTQNAELREEARRLKEDPSAIEEIARRDLGLMYPDERLFILKDVESRDPR